jgi:hypothetical protein
MTAGMGEVKIWGRKGQADQCQLERGAYILVARSEPSLTPSYFTS